MLSFVAVLRPDRLAVALVALVFFASAAEAQSDRWKDRIRELAAAHKGKVAVAVSHPSSKETFFLNEKEVMPTASLIKLAVMVEAYRQADAGRIDLKKLATLKEEDKVPGSGILTQHFSAGTQLSVRDSVRLMMAYSDNTGTNLVLDAIGIPATAKAMEELGYPETKIHSKVYRRDLSVFPERSVKYGLGSTTAADMVSILERLLKGELANEESTKAMIAHLRSNPDKETFSKHLPATAKYGYKGGAVDRIRTAAGFIDVEGGPLLVAVLTAENTDQSWTLENSAQNLIARITKEAFDRFSRPSNPGRPGSAQLAELKVGAGGPLVETLQRTLNDRLPKEKATAVDGDFGPSTEAAVIAFQKMKSLPETGVVNQDTWKALGRLVTDRMMVTEVAKLDMSLPEKTPLDPLDGAPFVTCKAWAIGDAKSGELIAGGNADQPLPMASTTKMMTAYIVLREAAKNPSVLDEMMDISERADRTPGSTADIRAGERISVGELLYGLMLPSGNDAATAYAEHFGARFKGPADEPEAADPVVRFVAEMNRTAEQLGMAGTRFADPHGLSSDGHHARARDLVMLAKALIDDGQILKYVETRKHAGKLEGASGYTRYELWKNTNRLLDTEGYLGMKTGTTTPAGACLVAIGERDGRKRIVVVLGSTSSDARYTDSRNLFRFAWTNKGGQKVTVGGE
ncbi:D-alanyl-D-alanine carboxypeptidase DacB precursor [Caulifigura coniformis]|uniref:beta-lactamase n=1 Tax=Caulifigura coniformis TaxID=2527983 RepID=A0A517SJY1_9PLAN|nr:serine hydrolase [Caulifigura coniformis]QDT56431.1 D-alanyl-D-alanine carboxypeptidase DacB precursor [Caulifigura coniformis]